MKVIFLILLFAVASCNIEMQEPEEQSLEMNYNEFIKCFTELSRLLPELIDIIQLIKAGDWTEVAVKSIELVSKRYPIVKEFISAFIEPINLTQVIEPINVPPGKKCCAVTKRGIFVYCVLFC